MDDTKWMVTDEKGACIELATFGDARRTAIDGSTLMTGATFFVDDGTLDGPCYAYRDGKLVTP